MGELYDLAKDDDNCPILITFSILEVHEFNKKSKNTGNRI